MGTLDRGQRRVLLGVAIVVGAATTVPASYNFVLVPMLHGLGASESQGSLLRQLPSIAGLLVIFLAGILGRRWGERRFITRCGLLFTVGSVTVALAPGLGVVIVGLVLESIGASGFIVVALALLSSQVSDDKARASAFATYAMVGPAIYITMPLLAGVIVDHASWRIVAGIWTLAGLVILVVGRALLPRADPSGASRELLTPALAGVVLMAVVQTVSAGHRDGPLSVAVAVWLGLALVAFITVVRVFRRAESPSLSLAALRQGGMSLLLLIVILVSFANLWFYLNIGFQYIFGLDALQTAAAMLPAQMAGIGGALISRALIRRLGITAAGLIMLGGLAGSLLLSTLITAASPLWLPIVVMISYAIASVGASIPITNAVMNLAPRGAEGSTSAFRSSAVNVGAAVGVVVMSTIVFAAFSASLSSSLQDWGLNSAQSVKIAESLRNGASSEDVSASYSVPLQRVHRIATAQREAYADGLRAHGLSGAAFTGVCLLIFTWSRRRQARAAETPSPELS